MTDLTVNQSHYNKQLSTLHLPDSGYCPGVYRFRVALRLLPGDTQGRTRMIYNSILETIGRTPVVRINHLAPSGITMYVKCEFFNPASSVKDRLAIAIIEDAERSGALKPG